MNFSELNLNEQLLEAIGYMGFEKATPIQEQAIPEIMHEKDLIACAQTGTGKTAAFMIPILNKLAGRESKGVNTLVLVPTRELAIQIDQQIHGFAYFTNTHSVAVYGGGDGGDYDAQKKAMQQGADIVVATPGRIIAHLEMNNVDFSTIEHVVLDEADRMLDIGFYDDILRIFSFMPKKRQTLMFSATMPPKIRKLASEILNDPKEITIAISKPAEGVLQATYLCYDNQKTPLIEKLIADKPHYQSILIFSSTKKDVFQIVRALKAKGLSVEGISSDLEQKEREDVLMRFRSKRTRILVATDVLSRGIDIKDINLVINYNVPNDAEDYVHRIGRTARAETTGVALTLINPADMYKFKRIEELIEREVIKLKPPVDFGEAPEWKTGGGDKKRRSFKPRKSKKT